jgi:hypothetical protein
MPPQVEIDDLRDLGEERPDQVLEQRVIEARAWVQQHDSRTLDHPRAGWDELGTVHVEVEPHVTDGHPHDRRG